MCSRRGGKMTPDIRLSGGLEYSQLSLITDAGEQTMTDMMKKHGAFSWNELMTTDIKAAKTFYGDMFGWVFNDMQSNDMEYTTVKAGDQDVAGITGMPPEAGQMPPMWGAYVTVDDVEASAKQAEALGGKILLAPLDIPDIGKFCVIADPQGAALSMITYLKK